MWTKWLIVATIVATGNGQLISELGNAARRLVNRGRTTTRQVLNQAANIGIGGEIQVQPGAISGNGRIVLPLIRTHLDVDQRSQDALDESLDREFDEFKILYNKTYSTPEIEFLRKQNFKTNRQYISRFNQDYSFGLSNFILKLNSFADVLSTEFNSRLNGFRSKSKTYDPSFPSSAYIPPRNVDRPASIDWRQLGAVTSVKHQGMCASCHAFSAAGTVEGQHFRKTGILVDLSPQNLLDCLAEKEYESLGCTGGGYVVEDLKYIKENPGIDKEEAYAYEGRDGPCRFREEAIGANITGYVQVPVGDEQALETILATLGPISVAIDASQQTFQFYSQGVYYEPNCKNRPENMNHAMLLVGYGEEADGQSYWLVKNSYGTGWGIGGYLKIAKDRNNHCGIATSALYPLV